MATKTVYDDVFGFKRKSQTTTATLSPRIEDYAEIFGGFLRGAISIPVLDLPPADLVGVPVSFRGRCFDYSEVFGGVDEGESFAVFEEVVKRCCDDDSDQAWTPAQSETLSDDLEPFACTNSYQSISNADFHPSSNDIKQFKVSYNKVFHTSEDDIANGVAHVAQLNDVPGYSFLVDEPPPLQKMVVINNLKHEDFGVGIEEGKPSRETTLCDNKPFVTISDISLKTRPSHLPPPSRPPPVVGPKNRDNNTQSSKIKVSRSFAYEETTSADNSPLFYDVEVDASTSAAVSAAVMQDVMEKAQKKLKSAKYKKDRSKQASERDLGAVKNLADNSTKHGKGYGLLQESSNEGNVEWKQDEEFYEVTETNDHRNMISVRDNQRVGVHDFRASQVISQQEELNRKMKSDDGILENIIVESVEGEGFVKMTKVRKGEDEDERKCKVHLGLEENGIRLEENLEREAKERAQNEKRIKEKVEREEKEKTKREALEREEEEKRQKQAGANELEAKILREANEKEENETRLRLVLEEKERKRRLAWEREEKEKSEKDARERELEQNRLREAIEKEEAEKRLRLALEEKEKKLREAWEMEEKEKKERETREREDEEKRLQAAIEKEENEKRLRLALEENERKIRETQEKEKEIREKEAREREEKEKKVNEDREREEKEKRENEAREREENERREKEALEREIEEMRLKKAHEENQKKQKEACEREEKEKRDKKAREREIEEKVQREAIEQEENENRLKIALEKEENETERLSREKTEAEKRLKDDEMWLNTEGVPNSTLKNEENTEKVKEGCEQKEDAQVEEVYEREAKEKRSEEPFEHEAIDKMWEEDYRLDENIAICGAASKVDKDSGEAKTTNGLFLVKDTIDIEVQVGNLKSFGVAQGNLQHKNSEIRVDEAKESLHVHDIMFEFDKKPLKKTASLMKPNVVDYHLGERGATLKKVQEGKDKKDAKVKVQSQNPERKGKSLDDVLIREEKEREDRMKREREQENERLRKIAEEREREKEREKDRMAVNMASLERENADTRLAEARERSEKANAEAKLRAERAAVERATAEARERAFQKAKAGKATVENRERIVRRTQSSLRSDSCQGVGSTNGSKNASSLVNGGVEVESAERCKARLERHQRTAQRAAKALEEKNMRDLLVLRELAERNRLAEGLDAEVKRWSSGKEGNLRALLSTLQYILGADSGWKPLHLTEVITSAAVKSAYRKATLCVHPDKLQQRGANVHQKYICEKVFDLLKAAWNKFNSEER